MQNEALRVSLVVPAYNEATRLAVKAELLNDAVANGVIDPNVSELIVVDDGSTDGTGDLAQKLLAPSFPRMRTLRLAQNSGKGAAIRAGAAVAAAPFVAFMDADMSVDPSQIPLLLAALENSDVAIGSRSLSESAVQQDSLQRVLMGRSFNVLVNAVTKVGLKDTQCGFKAFRTPVARILFHLMVVNRFAFDVELLCLARLFGMEISEVPVQWQGAEDSTVRPVADSMSMALDVMKLRWRKKRPHIPALVVTADSKGKGANRGEIMEEAFATFRQTDPILPLPHERALVLLPLCQPTEVHGAATRLGTTSTNLSIRRRFVSCNELTTMMPLAWTASGTPNSTVVRESGVTTLERRRHGSLHDIGELELTDSFRREA